MQNVSSLRGKDGKAVRWGSLRLSQVSDDGFHFCLEEGVAARVVMQGLEFVLQLRTTVYPSVQCFYCALGTAAWQVKQSQFGLAVGTECEHVFRSFWCLTDSVKIRNFYHSTKSISADFTWKRTKTDINGQKRTLTDIALWGCIIFAVSNQLMAHHRGHRVSFSPLERGRGVLECICIELFSWMLVTHPLPPL